MSRLTSVISVLLLGVFFGAWSIGGVNAATPAQITESEKSVIRIDRTDFPTLYLGTPEITGEAVWLLQARLHELGYDISPTGSFDQTTFETIRLFQIANRLPADGVVTRSVWEKVMGEEYSKPCLAQEEKEKKVRIEIDIAQHRLTLFENGKAIKTFPVGVGKSKTPSPLGEWKVVQKSLHWGNGFGTRWMGLNVPWGIYGVHGTNKPYSIGQSQSHGCIRMRNSDVEALYPLVPMGTKVKIVENGQIFPRNFKGRKLKRNSSGQEVVYLQSRLKELGIILDNADGRFGYMTELALKYYQVWHGLEATGIADEETYRSLKMIK